MLLGNDVHTACYYLASIFDDLSILHCTFSFSQLHDMNALTVAAAACKCTMQHKAFGSETQAAPMQIELEVRTQNEAFRQPRKHELMDASAGSRPKVP